MFLSCTATSYLEVSALVLSKTAANGCLRGTQTSKINIFEAIILNQKRGSATEVIHVFRLFL